MGFQKWVLAGVLGISNLQAAVSFSEDFESGLGKRWEPVKFEGATKYSVIKDGTNSALQAEASSSASGLGTRLDIPVKPATTLSWRWKMSGIPKGSSDDTKKTFDHTVRLWVAFKTRLGPPRTINYVWGNTAAAGKVFEHPSSGRAKFITLQSGDAKAGQWLNESRNVYADWKTLFGEDEPPNIVSVGLMTDSDGTKTSVTGWYDDIVVK